METLLYALKVLGIILVMTMIVPLMVAGGTGSWRHGWNAWKSYLKVMGGMVALGGGFGLLMIAADWLSR